MFYIFLSTFTEADFARPIVKVRKPSPEMTFQDYLEAASFPDEKQEVQRRDGNEKLARMSSLLRELEQDSGNYDNKYSKG